MRNEHIALGVALRHELHANPELSMQEVWTKQRLMDFLREHTALELIDRGNWFFAAYRSGSARPGIAFRADMDGVPVEESPELVPYASCRPGAGHKCGHDGHCASLAAFALGLEELSPDRDVFLLFQHAEETGQGAVECAALLEEENISEIYAFHNLPGLSLGAAAAPDGVAQFASTGVILRFKGEKSHASYPENGRNPAYAIAEIISRLPQLAHPGQYQGLVLITVIQVNVGERAFGTSAGAGELLLTVRAEREEELDALLSALEKFSRETADAHGLAFGIAYEDRFPETRNHPAAAEKVRRAAERAGIPVETLPERFRASEDFGHYTKRIPGAMFYIGDGDSPPLHTAGFDFPDALIPVAVRLFRQLLKE